MAAATTATAISVTAPVGLESARTAAELGSAADSLWAAMGNATPAAAGTACNVAY